MTDRFLPDSTRRHFNLKQTRSSDEGSILNFCIKGLLIPAEHLWDYERIQNMDAFWVYTRNGIRFSVSGPELAYWESRRPNDQ